MKSLFFVLAVGFASLSAQAGPFDWRGGGGGRGNVTCSVDDAGWEEHYGGHSDCGSCLREHGSCIESCKREETYCTAEGTNNRGSTSSTETFHGRGSDRWDAERDAVNECRRFGASGCSVKSCDTQSQIVSSRRCN